MENRRGRDSPDRSSWTYGALLDWHLGRRKRGKQNSFNQFADSIAVHPLTLYQYRHDRALPSGRRQQLIERALFGGQDLLDPEVPVWIEEMRRAYERARRNRLAFRPALDVRRLTAVQQATTGAYWVEKADQLAVSWAGAATDQIVLREPLNAHLQKEVIRKSRAFAEIAPRLDNAYGWTGIAAVSARFANSVDCAPDVLAQRLGLIYSAILELGSFLEQDISVSQGGRSLIDPLDPEVRRSFMDLIRTAAPWLRRFPTIRELDDELGAFLLQPGRLRAAIEIIPIAEREELIPARDAEALSTLAHAGDRGADGQARKAATHATHSVRNLVITGASVIVGVTYGVYLEATGAVVGERSIIARKAAEVILTAEDQVISLVSDLPDDIRIALVSLLKELKSAKTSSSTDLPLLSPNPAPRWPTQESPSPEPVVDSTSGRRRLPPR